MGHFLAAIGYVAPSPNHVQNNVSMFNSTSMSRGCMYDTLVAVCGERD